MANQYHSFITLDWLQVTYKTKSAELLNEDFSGLVENETVSFADNVQMIFLGIGDKFYKYRGEVFVDGESICYILFQPRSKILADDLVNLTLKNELLYTTYWQQVLEVISTTLALQFNNITRLDIAIDTDRKRFDVMDFINKYLFEDSNIVRTGKKELRYEQLDDKTKRFGGFQVGNMAQDKMIKGYDKTKEIEDSSKKKYISDCWSKSGFGENVRMFRVEMRLKAKAIKRIKDFDFSSLDSSSYIASIFMFHARNTLDFRYRTSEKQNVCNMEKVQLIDYDKLGAVKLERVKKVPKNSDRTARIVTKFVYELYRRETLGEAKIVVDYLVQEFGLKDWYNKRVDEWNFVHDNGLHADTGGLLGLSRGEVKAILEAIRDERIVRDSLILNEDDFSNTDDLSSFINYKYLEDEIEE